MGAEILAPCGSVQCLEAALRSGCNAVYLGGARFSARGRAANFSEEELREAVFECHRRGVKVHLAINTIIRDDETDECVKAVSFAAEVGIDALIVQDLAVYAIAKELFPTLELHASTQMTVHSESGIRTVKELGFSRAVLSRELPLDVIKRLSDMGIETEVFVHGALCMSVSGQCFMSAFIGSRSANRGLCAQACRLPVSADGGRDDYALSLKDVSLLPYLKELDAAGVDSFKIEGRMKRPEYVAAAVDSCVRALEGREYDLKTLESVFSRSGFTDGYYHHKLGSDMFGRRSDEDAAAAAKVFPSIHEIYRTDEKRCAVDMVFSCRRGEPISLTMTDGGGAEVTVTGAFPEDARSKAWDAEFVKSRLSKLGGTIYEAGELVCGIDDGLAQSAAVLGELRRQAVEALDKKRAELRTKSLKTDKKLHKITPADRAEEQEIRIKIRKLSQLDGLDMADIGLVCVPMGLCERAVQIVPAEKIAVTMPRFTFGESEVESRLSRIKELGITHMLGENIGHFALAKEHGFVLHTDFTLNIANSYSLEQAGKTGAQDCIISPELTAAQIGAVKRTIPFGVYAYGRVPLMLTANCPIRQQVGCRSCTGHITDRTRRKMPVRCSEGKTYAEIFNSDVIYITDRIGQFKNADFFLLDFLDETAEEIKGLVKDLRNALNGSIAASKPKNATFGLYSRGVI